jgi:protein-tyrosine phosphatase
MFDLHCHLLPGIDDGAPEFETSLEMARAFVDQGVEVVVCTPHILPGLYHNTGQQIRQAVAALQERLGDAGVPLKLEAGADNHVIPQFVDGLKRGHLLTLAGSAYALAEPPHHVAPARLEDLFFDILLAGYVPLLTHPERLSWIENKYSTVQTLAARGVWMQITSGSLTGRFGRRPRYWAERMLEEGIVHILATDAHDLKKRPPDLLEGRRQAVRLVGETEATHLTVTRPQGILLNRPPSEMPKPASGSLERSGSAMDETARSPGRASRGGFGHRVWRLFG